MRDGGLLLPINSYDLIINWRVNQVCGFKCSYCSRSLNSNVEHNRYSLEIERFFLNTDRTLLICMTGGDPFLYPHFVDFCEKVTSKHRIGIFTNLVSREVWDFAQRIRPEKVEFMECSVHIQERERLGKVDDFVTKFWMLRQKGFNVAATIVAHPFVLARLKDLHSYFDKRGIALILQNLQGRFEGKYYPRGYTIEERAKLGYYSELAKAEAQRVRRNFGTENLCVRLIDAPYSWEGSPCRAGKDYIYLEYDGTFTRCLTQKDYLGSVTAGGPKLYTEPKPCTAKICKCGYHGLYFAEGEFKIAARKDMGDNYLTAAIFKSCFDPLATKHPKVKLALQSLKKIAGRKLQTRFPRG